MTTKDKNEIREILGTALYEQDIRWGIQLDERFNQSEKRLEERLDQKWENRLDERFTTFEIKLDKKLGERFEQFAQLMSKSFDIQTKWLDDRMDHRFGQFREYMDEKFQVVAEGYRMTNERLDRVDGRLGSLETRFDRLEGQLLLSGVIA